MSWILGQNMEIEAAGRPLDARCSKDKKNVHKPTFTRSTGKVLGLKLF